MNCRQLWISLSVVAIGCTLHVVDSWRHPRSRVPVIRRTFAVLPWKELRGGAAGDEDLEIIELEAVVSHGNVSDNEGTAVENQDGAEAAPEENDDPPTVSPKDEEESTAIETEQDETAETDTSTQEEETADNVIVEPDEDQPQENAEQAVSIDDEEEEEEETTSTTEDEDDVLEETEAHVLAAQLRLRGKELHDEGDWDAAADTFREASTILEEQLDAVEELATCRLHEALCRLKQLDYAACSEVCTSVLEREDGIPAAIQARAHHRRAKAKLGLGDVSGALNDARSAAFLGDRKAVALYGRLMRETSSPSSLEAADDSEGSASSSPLNDLLQGRNPFLPSGNDASSALMESLLNKSGGPTAGKSGGGSPLGPLGDMASMLSNMGGIKKKQGGGLAQSVMKSLTKRLEDESTQDTICGYLQNTDGPKLQQLASMAGVTMTEGQASQLASFCHGVTPQGIRKNLRRSRRLWYVVSLIRKTMQIVAKYKHIIVLLVLLSWIKSAILRPIPISKKAAKLALEGK